MALLHNTFGIAARNFTAYPEMPDVKALVEYGVKMEQMGFDSLWVWDHILLGVEPSFPVAESLTLLTAIAARTSRIKLSTGVLVLPLRNPVVLAKQLATIDQLSDGRLLLAMAAGWYKREFDAVGVPFERRGRVMDENLDILKRFWTEDMVKGEWTQHKIPAGVMYPKPVQKPRPPILIGGYVDRVLKRAAVAGDGWLTYFYRPESFAKSWQKVRDYAKEAGKDPDALMNGAQLPIMVGKSRADVESRMMEWLVKEWDYAAWSESTKESAIMGTVDECVAQLKEHLAVGVQKLIFVPYQYEMSQIEIIATQIVPRLRDFGRVAAKSRAPTHCAAAD
jgi:probable F420-dependent oxidoreductase